MAASGLDEACSNRSCQDEQQTDEDVYYRSGSLSASVLLAIGSHGDGVHGDVSATRGTVVNWSNVSIFSDNVEDVY